MQKHVNLPPSQHCIADSWKAHGPESEESLVESSQVTCHVCSRNNCCSHTRKWKQHAEVLPLMAVLVSYNCGHGKTKPKIILLVIWWPAKSDTLSPSSKQKCFIAKSFLTVLWNHCCQWTWCQQQEVFGCDTGEKMLNIWRITISPICSFG